ncbi:MAG TPA: VPLPA-CTERM-specific exosortase XrtD [Dongiaceae bacterium]|nr:VPLPA-CTERM-specific exosortase XrtD [Dongiaceae bacterium]
MDTSLSQERQGWSGLPSKASWRPWIVGALGVAGAAIFFWKAMVALVFDAWLFFPEYNHCPIIPFIAAFMLWRDFSRTDRPRTGGYAAIPLIVLALALGAINVVGPSTFPAQVGLYIWICGFVIASEGERRILAAWPGLVYLAFALPLSIFFFRSLQSFMQLLSSRIGVEIVQVFDVPVFLEGNVLDFGTFKLQVAEACSGLRYLFPMASFAFLCAYLFQGARWQKALIVLAAAPIAILMNSFRIAITGIIANWIGLEIAEGFLHAFEGWVIFVVCLIWLFAGMKLLCLLDGRGRSLVRRLDLTMPPLATLTPRGGFAARAPMLTAVGLTMVGAVFAIMVGHRSELIPQRAAFDTFPRQIDAWQGVDVAVDPEQLAALHPSDYLSLNFSEPTDLQPVNVWIPYYASQRDGSAAHPPELCIPAGGWTMDKIEQRTFQSPSLHQGRPFELTRIVISQGNDRQLVYYWFQSRGRFETDVYGIKLNIVRDSVLYQRTDGSLVRFVTPIASGPDGLAAADARMQRFIGEIAPQLERYIPN